MLALIALVQFRNMQLIHKKDVVMAYEHHSLLIMHIICNLVAIEQIGGTFVSIKIVFNVIFCLHGIKQLQMEAHIKKY